jgi:uncharacterized phage-associated protein
MRSKPSPADASALDEDERDSVDRVVKFYGDKPSWWLVECTHAEAPWRDERAGVPEGYRCENVIPVADMAPVLLRTLGHP